MVESPELVLTTGASGLRHWRMYCEKSDVWLWEVLTTSTCGAASLSLLGVLESYGVRRSSLPCSAKCAMLQNFGIVDEEGEMLVEMKTMGPVSHRFICPPLQNGVG